MFHIPIYRHTFNSSPFPPPSLRASISYLPISNFKAWAVDSKDLKNMYV